MIPLHPPLGFPLPQLLPGTALLPSPLRGLSGSPSPWASLVTPAVSGAIAEAPWPLSLMGANSSLDFRPLHGAMELPGQHFRASVSSVE